VFLGLCLYEIDKRNRERKEKGVRMQHLYIKFPTYIFGWIFLCGWFCMAWAAKWWLEEENGGCVVWVKR